jgi:hypothetical protein
METESKTQHLECVGLSEKLPALADAAESEPFCHEGGEDAYLIKHARMCCQGNQNGFTPPRTKFRFDPGTTRHPGEPNSTRLDYISL